MSGSLAKLSYITAFLASLTWNMRVNVNTFRLLSFILLFFFFPFTSQKTSSFLKIILVIISFVHIY